MAEDKQTIMIKDEIRSDMAGYSIEEKITGRPILSDLKRTIKLIKTDEDKYMILINPIKGNNIIVPCESLEEVADFIEKIMLNLEKARLDDQFISAPTGQRIKVESSKFAEKQEDKGMLTQKIELYEELYAIYGNEFDEWDMYSKPEGVLEFDEATKERISKKIKADARAGYGGQLSKPKQLTEEENARADKIIEQLLEIIETEDCNYILANLEQIEIDGKPLETTRNIAQELIERAKVKIGDKTAINFNESGYNNAVQDYLLKSMYSEKILLTEEQKEGIAEYKKAGFMTMNALMRGDFEKLIQENTTGMTIDSMVSKLLKMESITKVLPKRKYDIILSRRGTGIEKNVDVGSKNKYESYVSFGTNLGSHIGNQQTTVLYQRVLRADEPAIPIDVACEDALIGYSTECELLTLPMQYEVMDATIDSKGIQNITMGNIENIPVSSVLEKRLQELKVFLEEQIKISTGTPNIDKMIEETIAAINIVELSKNTSSQETIETEQLRYFDDEPEKIFDEKEAILAQVVEDSKERVGLKKINKIINFVRTMIKHQREPKQTEEEIINGDR